MISKKNLSFLFGCFLFLPFSLCQEGKGYIDVTSDPETVNLYINNKFHGVTPITLELDLGVNEIRATKDGYGSARKSVTITNVPTRLHVVLQNTENPESLQERTQVISMDRDLGSLIVSSEIPGTPVFINENKVGTTTLLLKKIETGKYKLKIDNKEQDITIYANYRLNVKLEAGRIVVQNDLLEIQKSIERDFRADLVSENLDGAEKQLEKLRQIAPEIAYYLEEEIMPLRAMAKKEKIVKIAFQIPSTHIHKKGASKCTGVIEIVDDTLRYSGKFKNLQQSDTVVIKLPFVTAIQKYDNDEKFTITYRKEVFKFAPQNWDFWEPLHQYLYDNAKPKEQ